MIRLMPLNAEQKQFVIDTLLGGGTASAAAEALGMQPGEMYKAISRDALFRAAVRKAREDGSHCVVDRIENKINQLADPRKARIIAEHEWKRAGKYNRELADRVDLSVTHTIQDIGEVMRLARQRSALPALEHVQDVVFAEVITPVDDELPSIFD